MKSTVKDQSPKTAVIYTRVSTDDQAEHGFSLAHQEDLLRKECARRGVHILEHFQDDGYSAKDFKRPNFQNLIAYLKRHKKQIQYLLVTKWCRFSRDVGNTIVMNRELQTYGTRVITLDDWDESDNPASFLLSILNMTLPEIDNRIRSRNTRAGILRALKEGFYPYGGAPKGYSKDKGGQKTPLLIPNELAPLVKEAFEVFATGAFPIEDVRRASWKNGLKLQRSQFGQMLRNSVYMGKIEVPKTEHEESYLVDGVHQAIITTDLFWKVQKILDKRMETRSYLCIKEKLRDELPLRGHLKCPQCSKNWTGSISSGNGGRYAYYHCENGCKSRVSAKIAHDELFQFLNTLQPSPEIIDLQMAMMEALFRAKEGDRDLQIKKLKFEIERQKQNLLKLDQQRFLLEELEADSYQRLKLHTLGQIDKFNLQIGDLEITDTAFQKYAKYGMCLLKDLTWYFQEAELEAKRTMLSSIFPGKLTFEDGKYRTDGLNPALAIILQKSNGLQNEKTGNAFISENVSGDVPMTGLEPALYC